MLHTQFFCCIPFSSGIHPSVTHASVVERIENGRFPSVPLTGCASCGRKLVVGVL